MTKRPPEPAFTDQEDIGFYGRVPRALRTSPKYRGLPLAARWLYVSLRDLCGEQGVCFRTIPTLAQEADLSTGSVSRMIPRLVAVGLIGATKQKRMPGKGHEVWHLTVTDIWSENAALCHQIDEKNVQNLNESVQNLNKTPTVRSRFEQHRSNFADRRRSPEEESIEEQQGKKKEASPSLQGGGQGKRSSISPASDLTQEGLHLLLLYEQFKGRKMLLTEETKQAANQLGSFVQCDEDFLAVLNAIEANDFLKKKQVRWGLMYVYRKYNEYFEQVERKRGKVLQGSSAGQDYNEVAGLTEKQRAEYRQEQREKLRAQEAELGVDREILMQLPPAERIAYLQSIQRTASDSLWNSPVFVETRERRTSACNEPGWKNLAV